MITTIAKSKMFGTGSLANNIAELNGKFKKPREIRHQETLAVTSKV